MIFKPKYIYAKLILRTHSFFLVNSKLCGFILLGGLEIKKKKAHWPSILLESY
jgi:hypothetical protein